MQLDIALRAAGAASLLFVASALVLSARQAAVARWFVPFALGIAGFLGVNTAFDAAELPGPLWSIASFLSRMAAVFLWLFCLVLFDGRLRAPAVAAAVGGAWFAIVVIDKGYLAAPPSRFDPSAMLIVLGTGLVLHAGWRAIRDLHDDLIASRRRARPFFALGLLALLGFDLAVDVLQGYGWRPASFLLMQNAVIVALVAGLGLWLLRADDWLTAAPALPRPVPGAAPGAARDPEAELVMRLQAFMQAERPYLDPELTFAGFATRFGAPEPALRRAINHRLGHGHFRSFVNEYRVEEAKRRLRDPAAVNDKIVAIALDSGFSSLASFNRVFRQAVGRSPSEYRATAADAGPSANADLAS